jgi:hypothetical protein
MKMVKLAILVLTIAVALFILIPNLSWAMASSLRPPATGRMVPESLPQELRY